MSFFTRKLFFLVIALSFCGSLFARKPDVFEQDIPVYEGRELLESRIKTVKEKREPFALVLSGGSARAYAHIGVLKVLEKNNIKPDLIVANSMGAIIGLLYSAGFGPDDIEYLISNLDINSFFDMVFPLKGGVMNARYFREVLNRLFPENHFDIKDGFIPVIIPAEDLITKRIVYFSEGSIDKIMTAAFSMIFTMEPVDYVLSDGMKVKLTDAGTVDIGQLGAAMELTDNILLSTAFYQPEVDLNNVIVNLNRTFAIGKERQAIRHIKENDIPYIRNEVETTSFMDFKKIKEIIGIGERCSEKFLEENSVPVNGGFDFSDPDFIAMRHDRSERVKDVIRNLNTGLSPVTQEIYGGMKIRPNIPLIDTPLFDLNEDITGGVYGFMDLGPVFIRAGGYAGKNNFGPDVTVRMGRDKGFSSLTYASLFWNYDLKMDWYAGEEIGFKYYFMPGFYVKPFVTAEIAGYDLFCKGGVDLSFKRPVFRCRFMPYSFLAGNVKEAEGVLSVADRIGYGASGKIDLTVIPVLGFGLSENLKFQKNNSGLFISQKDLWRGVLSGANENLKSYMNLLQGEVYLYESSMSISMMESFLLEKMKSGAYCDFLSSDDYSNFAAGGFVEVQFAFMGLYKFNMTGFGGWDFDAGKPVFGLTLKENW